MEQARKPACPHCGQEMTKWRTPDGNTWVDEFHYVCFNDGCAYYRDGWKHMEATRGVACSYRHMVGQRGQWTGPLSVPTPESGREMIIEEGCGCSS